MDVEKKTIAEPRLLPRIKFASLRRGTSTEEIVLFAFAASFLVLACTLFLQWLVYNHWLHQTSPLHIVGGAVAAVLTFLFIFWWQSAIRKQQAEMLRRFKTIAEMNDRIRNALQVIACTAFASNPDATEHVRQAVKTIDGALQGLVADERLGATETKTAAMGARVPQSS